MTHYLDAAMKRRAPPAICFAHAFSAAAPRQRDEAHDIKLEIDVRAQELITQIAAEKFPEPRALRRRRNRGRPDERIINGWSIRSMAR